jgi:SOS-response transcriptional repressor LexA
METRVGLTPRQAEVLHFLKVYNQTFGYYPTVREICAGKVDGEQLLPSASAQSNIHRIMNTLERKGYIHKEVNSPRGIAVL